MDEYNRAIHTRADTLETSGNNADHAIKFARLAAAYAIELGKPDSSPSSISRAADSDGSWPVRGATIAVLAFAAWLAIGAGLLHRSS